MTYWPEAYNSAPQRTSRDSAESKQLGASNGEKQDSDPIYMSQKIRIFLSKFLPFSKIRSFLLDWLNQCRPMTLLSQFHKRAIHSFRCRVKSTIKTAHFLTHVTGVIFSVLTLLFCSHCESILTARHPSINDPCCKAHLNKNTLHGFSSAGVVFR